MRNELCYLAEQCMMFLPVLFSLHISFAQTQSISNLIKLIAKKCQHSKCQINNVRFIIKCSFIVYIVDIVERLISIDINLVDLTQI